MKAKNKEKIKLFISTETYPYDDTEKTFIQTELIELLKEFDVYFLSHKCDEEEFVYDIDADFKGKITAINFRVKLNWIKVIKYSLMYLFDRDGIKEIQTIIKEKKRIFFRIYQSMGFYALAMENYRLLKKKNIIPKDETVIYYSYWYTFYTYSMTKYKRKYPNLKIVTRTHRFDLYDEAYRGRRQPFKMTMDSNIDKVIFISNQGKRYYLNRYLLKDGKKYSVNLIGTLKPDDIAILQTEKTKDTFRLVSCSAIIPVKRIEFIIHALSMLEENVEWIHFGDGSENQNIMLLAKQLLSNKNNIKYTLHGYIRNEEIHKYYQTNYVDCFISTSLSEGLPVSIQEAISFGIPIIATDVGGVAELFENNGILLSANPKPEEIADAIKRVIHIEKNIYLRWRENSTNIWKQKYNAKENSRIFVEMLKNMVSSS